MVRSGSRSRTGAHGRLLLSAAVGALVVFSSVGCRSGVEWRVYQYNAEAVERDAGDRTRFVYFRHWAVPACTRFEENVLLDPQVLAATRPYYCIVLAYNVDKRLADDWGVSEPPGVALLGPGGRLLSSGSGALTKEQLLALFKRASDQTSPTTTKKSGSQ